MYLGRATPDSDTTLDAIFGAKVTNALAHRRYQIAAIGARYLALSICAAQAAS